MVKGLESKLQLINAMFSTSVLHQNPIAPSKPINSGKGGGVSPGHQYSVSNAWPGSGAPALKRSPVAISVERGAYLGQAEGSHKAA